MCAFLLCLWSNLKRFIRNLYIRVLVNAAYKIIAGFISFILTLHYMSVSSFPVICSAFINLAYSQQEAVCIFNSNVKIKRWHSAAQSLSSIMRLTNFPTDLHQTHILRCKEFIYKIFHSHSPDCGNLVIFHVHLPANRPKCINSYVSRNAFGSHQKASTHKPPIMCL